MFCWCSLPALSGFWNSITLKLHPLLPKNKNALINRDRSSFPPSVSTFVYHTIGMIPEIQRGETGSFTVNGLRIYIQTFRTLCSRSWEGRRQTASPRRAMRTWRTSGHSPTVSTRTSKAPSLNTTQCTRASGPVCWFCSSVETRKHKWIFGIHSLRWLNAWFCVIYWISSLLDCTCAF